MTVEEINAFVGAQKKSIIEREKSLNEVPR